MPTYPPFGCAGNVEAESITYNADQLEYRDGFRTDLFLLKKTIVWEKSKPSFCAQTYGIGESTDPTRNSLGKQIETATMTETEEVTPPHMLATQPGVSPNLGDKLTYTDGLIFFRKRIDIAISGEGDCPADFVPANIGHTFEGNLLIMPAVGDSPIIQISAGLFTAPIKITKSVTGWQKYDFTLTKYIGNTAAEARVNMIAPEIFLTADITALSAWYKITRTTTLTYTGSADVREQIEIYDDVATP